MLPIILWIIAGLVVLLLVVIALQPAAFRIERSTTISALPGEVFPRINDLRQFQEWSPWAKLDPNCKITFAGPESGTGSSFTWTGNNKVGEGMMTITESRTNELVATRLDFLRPMKQTNGATFALRPVDGNTQVTWSMTGEKNFVMKAFGLFMNMDKLIGRDFEMGLSQLKALSESTAKGAA